MAAGNQVTSQIDKNPELAKAMRAGLAKLPQRKKIPDNVVEDWIEATIATERERAIWHVDRAFGIGGSEIGELLLTSTGKPNEYNTLNDISSSKLLLLPPQRSNIYMRRGTAMEILAEKVYLRLSGHSSVLEQEDVAAAFKRPHKQHSYIIGNPDAVVDTQDRKRIITDFKVRSNLDTNDEIKLVNAAQTHWYGAIHEANLGRRPDGYALAELDIPTGMIDELMQEKNPDFDALADQIAAVNRPGFGMQIRLFRHNDNLSRNMIRLAGKFWESYVLSGTPYQPPKTKLPENLTDSDHEAVKFAQNKFLRSKLAEVVAKSEAEQAKDAAVQIASKFDLKKWPFETAGLSTGLTARFDIEGAASHLTALGVPKSSLTKGTNKPDIDAMMHTLESQGLLSPAHFKEDLNPTAVKAALKEKGVSAAEFTSNTVRMGITTKKADLEIRGQLEAAMISHIQRFDPTNPAPSNSTAIEHGEHTFNNELLDLDEPDPDEPGLTLA